MLHAQDAQEGKMPFARKIINGFLAFSMLYLAGPVSRSRLPDRSSVTFMLSCFRKALDQDGAGVKLLQSERKIKCRIE